MALSENLVLKRGPDYRTSGCMQTCDSVVVVVVVVVIVVITCTCSSYKK